MRRRQPLPALWLMTDERLGDGLWDALARLPRGGGVVFRDYATPAVERRARFDRVRAIARRRGLVLVVAGDAPPGRADGRHNRRAGRGIATFSAHDPAQAVAAMRAGADALFVSPVFATASHPGAPTLGPVRFGLLAKRLPVPVIALGGVDARRFRRLKPLGAYGWAAIDALSPQRQKRKAVPT
jgi:thiamine-phosphate pyrophosphorylase